MKNQALAILLVAVTLFGAGAGYLTGYANIRTTTTTSVSISTTTTTHTVTSSVTPSTVVSTGATTSTTVLTCDSSFSSSAVRGEQSNSSYLVFGTNSTGRLCVDFANSSNASLAYSYPPHVSVFQNGTWSGFSNGLPRNLDVYYQPGQAISLPSNSVSLHVIEVSFLSSAPAIYAIEVNGCNVIYFLVSVGYSTTALQQTRLPRPNLIYGCNTAYPPDVNFTIVGTTNLMPTYTK